MTENKNPENNGYSQQQQNITFEYTTHDSDPNKNPYDDIFSPVQRNMSEKNYSNSNETVPHNPSSNPYADMESQFDNQPRQQPIVSNNPYSRQPHTAEFIPKDITEFGRHMDERNRSRELHYLFYLMTIIGFISILTDFFVDPTAKTVIFPIIHTIILTILTVLMKKNTVKL